jgi:hypothetical protein
MKAIRTIGLAAILIGGVLGGGSLPAQPPSPWAQLMLIEYVDQFAGNGVGLEILNPSGVTVDLAFYNISIRFFNHTSLCTTSCPSGIDKPLVGLIPPGGTFVVGNTSYCNSCTDSCDFAFTYGGLNGNDAVLLTRLDTAIDMIGIPCYCIGPNSTSYNVDGVANALFQRNIARCIGNTTYYSDSNGVYVSGDTTTSWPDNRDTIVNCWAVSTDQCISRGHTEICCVLPIASLNVGAKIENCSSLITWTAEMADSFQIMKLEGDGAEMVRYGVVYPLPGKSEHDFRVHSVRKENSYYQIISWRGGERVLESDLVKAKRPEGNCLPEAVILFPVPASDDLFVHLPEPGDLKIAVYDLRGQLVLSHAPGSVLSEHFLSVKGLSDGVYFYRIVHGNNQLQTGKLLIHHE